MRREPGCGDIEWEHGRVWVVEQFMKAWSFTDSNRI